MKKYIKEIVALTFGLICGLITFVHYSGSAKECEPITISLNCSAVKSGIQFFYTEDDSQSFSEVQSVNSGEITEDKNIELQLGAKSLHKLKMGLGSNPGVVTLQNITITNGDSTVKISNFDNTIRNGIDEYYWDGENKVYIRSFQSNPYIIFQTPYNLDAKVNPTKSYKGAFIAFLLATLVFYSLIRIASLIAKKNNTSLKEFFGGCLASCRASLSSCAAFVKKYIKESLAVVIGLACGMCLYIQDSSNKKMDPIVISLNCSTILGGLQLYYTTDENQDFNNSQVVSAYKMEGENNHLNFVLGIQSLHKLRMDFGTVPGVISVKDITISGDKTVTINNFNNTITNDIDDVFWNGNTVFIKSLKNDPYVIFQTPFDIHAKYDYTHTLIKSLIAFLLITLIAYLVICLIIRVVTKKTSDFKLVYSISLLILAGLLASISAKILSEKVGSFYQNDISISAKVKTDNPINFEVFYTTSPEEGFNPLHMASTPLVAGENEVSVNLSTKHLNKLRIDFGTNPGNVEVEKLIIHGKDDIVIDDKDFNACASNEIEEIKVSDGKLHIKSSTIDPWMSFNKDFQLESQTITNIDLVIFVTLFLTLLAFFTIGIKVTSKHVEGKRAEDLCLIIIFIAICIAPNFFLTDKKVSESEKRNLAEFPSISDSSGFNSAFSSQFDSWYSDHFANRDEIVSFNNSIFQSEGNAQNANVIEGEDGWYFYKSKLSILNFTNIPAYNEDEMVLIKNYLLTINNWCNAHGKKFYFLICPNKATIYGEKVKHIKKFQSDENSDAMRMIRFLEGSGIKAVFSKEEIMKHKNDGELLYRKQDTHHSDMGAYYSYKAILDVIGKDFPVSATPLNTIPMWDYKDINSCDLKSMMPGAIKDDTSTYKHFDISGGQASVTSFVFSTDNPKNVGRLYMLGDSFSMSLQSLLSTNFQFVNANRSNQYWFPNEELDKIEAGCDIVLFEIVERHLSLLAHQTIDTKLQPYAPQQQAAVAK